MTTARASADPKRRGTDLKRGSINGNWPRKRTQEDRIVVLFPIWKVGCLHLIKVLSHVLTLEWVSNGHKKATIVIGWIKPPAKRQKSIALAKSESMVPNMQNLISRPMATLFLVSDAPQTSISRKTDLSSIIEVFPEFQLDQKGGKIQNPLCTPPHFLLCFELHQIRDHFYYKNAPHLYSKSGLGFVLTPSIAKKMGWPT